MPLYYKSGSSWKEFAPNPYPVGTVYYATKDVSPANLVGGTWAKRSMEDATEALTGLSTPSTSIGRVTSYNLNQTGKQVSGTINWTNGSMALTAATTIMSGLPKVSSNTVCGTMNAYSGSGESIATQTLTITTAGDIQMDGNRNLFMAAYSYIRGNISYTSSEGGIMGGGYGRLRANSLTPLREVA